MVFFCFVSKHHDGANFFILFLHIQHSDILIRLFVVNMVINFILEWKKNNSTHTHLNMKKCEKDIVIIMYPYMAILVIIVAKEMEKWMYEWMIKTKLLSLMTVLSMYVVETHTIFSDTFHSFIILFNNVRYWNDDDDDNVYIRIKHRYEIKWIVTCVNHFIAISNE